MADFSPEDVAAFAQSLGMGNSQPVSQDTGDSSLLTRSLKQGVNLIPNTLNVTGKDLSNLLLAPQDRPTQDIFPTASIAPATTLGEKAVDIIGGQLLPKAAEFAIPYAAISKLAGAAGIAGVGSEILSQGGAAALTSTDEGPEGMLRQGLTGAVLGAASPLSRLNRVLPLAAAATGMTAYDISQGQNPKDAAIQNAVQFGFGLLPSAHAPNPELKANPEIAPENTDRSLAILQNKGEIVQQPNFIRRGDPYDPRNVVQEGQFTMVDEHPTQDLGTFNMREPQRDLPAGRIPLLQNGLQVPNEDALPSGLRLAPEGNIQTGGIPFEPAPDVDTTHLRLQQAVEQPSFSISEYEKSLGLGAEPSPELQALNKQLAILQNASTTAEAQGWLKDQIVPQPKPQDFGIGPEAGTRRAFAAAKAINELNPILQDEPSITKAATDAGVTYQGNSDLGLHAFKDNETGGNFSIKQGEVTPDAIKTKAQSLRQSFQPDTSHTVVKLTKNDAEEIGHKLGILSDEPDLQQDYGLTQKQADDLYDSIPTKGGDWKIPSWAKQAVNSELKDHAEVLRNIAHSAFRDREQGQSLRINKQATRIENLVQNLENPNSVINQMKAARNNGNLSGAVSMHLASALGTGTAAGLYEYKESRGDWGKTAAAASLGLVAGALGYRVLRALHDSTPAVEKGLKASEMESIKKVAATPLKDLAGQDISGRGGIMSKFVRVLETQGWLNMPEEIKTALSQSKGKIVALAQQVNQALKGVKDYANISDSLKERASNYLKGQAANEADVKKLIASEGGVNHATWAQAGGKKENPDLNRVWTISDSNGEVTDIYHISQATFDNLAKLENDTLLKGLAGNELTFAKFVQSARLATNALQEMFSDAMPANSKLRDVINNSIGQYMTRGYKIFTDKAFWPTEENINKVIDKLGIQSATSVLDEALTSAKAYRVDDFSPEPNKVEKGWNTLMQQYQNSRNDAQFARLQNLVPLTHEGENFMVDPKVKANYESKFDKDLLRGAVEDYLHQTKTNKKFYNLTGTSSGLDTSLLKERQTLDPTFRELIGEFTDPVEQVTHVLNRLIPTAKAAALMQNLKNIQIHDLPATFEDSASYVAYKKSLQAALELAQAAGNKEQFAILQSRLSELLTYRNVGPDLKFGLLKDTYASRFVTDQFKDYNGPWGDMSNPIARGMAKANQISKLIHAPYNPINQARNLFQAPIFMAIGRVDPTNIPEAWKAFRDANHPLHGEILREGILPATHASSELGFNLDKLTNGEFDSDLTKSLKGIHNFVLDKYNIPDALTRVATYLSAKDRFASKMGLGLDHPDVIQKAVAFTNRYTMNYENVAPVVKLMRNIPAFNLYISYTAEITRIAKNLVEDSLKGDLVSMGILGGLAATPYILQKSAEANLSPEDRKQWMQLQNQLPAYARNRFRAFVSKDDKGNFHYTDITPLIVTDSIHQSIDAIRKGDIQSLLAVNPVVSWQNTPAWNIIAEQVSGRDLFSGREFRDYSDRLESLAKEVTPSWTPGIGSEYQKLASIGVTNQKTGRTESVEGAVLRWTTGLQQSSYNASIVNRQALSEVKQQIDLERSYLNDVLKTNIDNEKKQRAIQTYQDAVKTIVTRYQSRLLP